MNCNFTISNCKNNKNVKATVWASAYTTFDKQDKNKVLNSESSNTGTISGSKNNDNNCLGYNS